MTALTPHEIRPAKPGRIRIRDASLYVHVTGHGYPLLLMHGGPGAEQPAEVMRAVRDFLSQ